MTGNFIYEKLMGKTVLDVYGKRKLKLYLESIDDGFDVNIIHYDRQSLLLINEFVYYVTSEGMYDKSSNPLNELVSIIDSANIDIDRRDFMLDVMDAFFSKFKEDEIKSMWVVIPDNVVKSMFKNCYEVRKDVFGYFISFKFYDLNPRISLFYKSKLNGNDVYVGIFACDGYYGMYKNKFAFGKRVVCDDGWLIGRLFGGIDDYKVKSKVNILRRKIKFLDDMLERVKR